MTAAATCQSRLRGFSLIEIMVGLVIAMVGVVIMMEVMLASEERSRTTTTGNDALTNGAVMMHVLQRDMKQAGFGLNSLDLFNSCSVVTPSGVTVPLVPVLINPETTLIPDGDANTDRLLVFYGSDTGQPEGNNVLDDTSTGSRYRMQGPQAFHAGDWVLVYPKAGCSAALTMAKVTSVDPDTEAVRYVNVDRAVVGSATVLYNLGPSPVSRGYAVRGKALLTCDFMQYDCHEFGVKWVAASGDIVSVRAQYGHDGVSPYDGAVDGWDQAKPSTACGWARTSAVKLVLVARSSQYESHVNETTHLREGDEVTAAAPVWEGTADGLAIDLTNPDDPSDNTWKYYRYKTFETVAPFRNVVWMGKTTC